MAVYNPIPISPVSGEGVDATQIIRFNWSFISDSSETQTSYRVQIYLISDTSSAIHDSGVISSQNEFYDLTALILLNANDYVWKVTVVGNGQERTNVRFALFKTLATPTVTIDPIGAVSQFKNFTATYVQAQGVKVKTYQWTLYNDIDEILEVSPIILSETIEYEFSGFENGVTYKIDVRVVNQNNVTTTSTRESFTASYTLPEDSPSIEVTSRPEYTSIEVDYANIINLIGEVIGTFSYVDGKFNKSLRLDDACLNVNLITRPIPQNFTITFWIKLDSSHDGDFWVLKKNNEIKYRVGYDSTLQRFYYRRNGREVYSDPIYELPDDYLLVGISSDTLYIRTFLQDTWDDIASLEQDTDWYELIDDQDIWLRETTWNDSPDWSWIKFGEAYDTWTEFIDNNFKLVLR